VRAIVKFMAVAALVVAGIGSADCRAEGSGTTSPVAPSQPPSSPTGSGNCLARCSPYYPAQPQEYNNCLASCNAASGTASTSGAPAASSVTPGLAF